MDAGCIPVPLPRLGRTSPSSVAGQRNVPTGPREAFSGMASVDAVYIRGRPSIGGKSSGQALVEFALLFPVLVALLSSLFDFGRFYYVGIVAADAAREGARLGTDYTRTNMEIQNRVATAAAGLTVNSVSITVTDRTTGLTAPSLSRNESNSGDTINVSVTINVVPLMPWTQAFLQSLGKLQNNEFPISETASMDIF